MRAKQILIRSRSALLAFVALAWLALSAQQALAAPPIDGDLVARPPSVGQTPANANVPAAPSQGAAPGPAVDLGAPATAPQVSYMPVTGAEATRPAAADTSTTYHKDDLIGAGEGVFGKGAAGLAGMIEDLLRKQGEPNGYIVGREGG